MTEEEIKLTRDEQETHINFTAQERLDGTINIFTDDPVWVNKLSKIEGLEDVSDQFGVKPPAKAFRSLNHALVLSLRRKQVMSEEQRAASAARLAKARKKIE